MVRRLPVLLTAYNTSFSLTLKPKPNAYDELSIMRRKHRLGPLGRRQCEGNWIDTEPNERVLRIAKYRVAVIYAQHNFLRRIELKNPTEIERQRRDPVRDGGEETAALQN